MDIQPFYPVMDWDERLDLLNNILKRRLQIYRNFTFLLSDVLTVKVYFICKKELKFSIWFVYLLEVNHSLFFDISFLLASTSTG